MRVSALVLCLVACIGCGAHNASDPEYGAMFKQATQDRVEGREFWGTRRSKDCVAGGALEVCTPPDSGAP